MNNRFAILNGKTKRSKRPGKSKAGKPKTEFRKVALKPEQPTDQPVQTDQPISIAQRLIGNIRKQTNQPSQPQHPHPRPHSQPQHHRASPTEASEASGSSQGVDGGSMPPGVFSKFIQQAKANRPERVKRPKRDEWMPVRREPEPVVAAVPLELEVSLGDEEHFPELIPVSPIKSESETVWFTGENPAKKLEEAERQYLRKQEQLEQERAALEKKQLEEQREYERSQIHSMRMEASEADDLVLASTLYNELEESEEELPTEENPWILVQHRRRVNWKHKHPLDESDSDSDSDSEYDSDEEDLDSEGEFDNDSVDGRGW